MPVSLVPAVKTARFKALLNKYFGITASFKDEDMLVVWITGYKPKGDDSRPDRGLTALARMVMGNRIKLMSIVYDPAKTETYHDLRNKNYESNGLWQSIFKLSDYALFDSINYPKPIFHELTNNRCPNNRPVEFRFVHASLKEFTEYDIDTTIHTLFTQHNIDNIKECFCNPPGGDWSGISYFNGDEEYRWTSLPRVSYIGGKRPDHIIEVIENNKDIFISIESKGIGTKLENKIGVNLKTYIEDIFLTPPTAKKTAGGDWHNHISTINVRTHRIISVGAFLFSNATELNKLFTEKQLDAIIAIEYGRTIKLHVVMAPEEEDFLPILEAVKSNFSGLIIKVH